MLAPQSLQDNDQARCRRGDVVNTILPNFGTLIGSYAQQFAAQMHAAVSGVDGVATLVVFYAALMLIPIGAILYWSPSRRIWEGGC